LEWEDEAKTGKTPILYHKPRAPKPPAVMSLFSRLAFEKSAHGLADLPVTRREIAFAGRSNAGKSSAINALAGRRAAFVSKTPGRTQLINFFRIADGDYLVDLPGYGYARVPEAVRRQWQKVLSRYLEGRQSLVGLVLIMDARHPLTPLDRQMIHWFSPTQRPLHCLLTKADKLSRSEAARTLRLVQRELAEIWPAATVQLFSSLKKEGLVEAEAVLARWLGRAA
jgi:GTP-binding protein